MQKIKEKIRYKLYRFKWWFADYIDFKSPIHIDIELNNNCNQACISCWHSDKSNLPFEISRMPLKTAANILNDARKAGALSVKFNLRGEPLLYGRHELLSLIGHAKKIGFVDIMLNTNGILLTWEWIEGFEEFGLTTLIVSVDSFKKEIYDVLHGVKDGHGDFFKMHAVLSFLDYYKFEEKINYNIVVNIHKNKLNQDEDLTEQIEKFKRFKFNIKDTQKRHGKDISLKQEKKKRKKKCPHMARRLTILSNNKVYPCCVCYNEPRDIQIYTVPKADIKQFWDSWWRFELLKDYNKKDFSKSCKNCTSGEIWEK